MRWIIVACVLLAGCISPAAQETATDGPTEDVGAAPQEPAPAPPPDVAPPPVTQQLRFRESGLFTFPIEGNVSLSAQWEGTEAGLIGIVDRNGTIVNMTGFDAWISQAIDPSLDLTQYLPNGSAPLQVNGTGVAAFVAARGVGSVELGSPIPAGAPFVPGFYFGLHFELSAAGTSIMSVRTPDLPPPEEASALGTDLGPGARIRYQAGHNLSWSALTFTFQARGNVVSWNETGDFHGEAIQETWYQVGTLCPISRCFEGSRP